MATKTVVCIWTTIYHPQFTPPVVGPGLGDLIRGAMGLYEYCLQKNYNFYLDIQLHAISNILDFPSSPFASDVKLKEAEIKFFQEPYKEIENSNDQVIFMATNICEYKKFSEQTILYLKSVLTPKKWVNDLFEAQIKKHNLVDYNIVHVRCGDNEFFKKQNKWKRFVAKQIIALNYKRGDLLLSDSMQLKKDLTKDQRIKIFTETTAHIGHKFDSTTLLNTMLEFYAICKAKKIKAYSRYSHLSGFVHFPSIIYNIPLEIMEMPYHIRLLDIVYNLTVFYHEKFIKKYLVK